MNVGEKMHIGFRTGCIHEENASTSMADELEPLCASMGLYVKPSARMTVTVCLPPLKQPGQSISNWDLMEKIKKAVCPIEVIKALDGYTLKVMGFFEPLKVRAAEAKSDFPTRHDWDEFFRNADNMNELEPGERPDTIYLAKMPSNWFKDCSSCDGSLPSENVLRSVFERFGTVRCVDIPICDPYRKKMSAKISGIRTTGFSFGQEVLFEGYVQFVEYISFVRAMDFLRNKKLVKKMSDDRVFEAAIKVDFDKNKHLSDKNIHKRCVERERLKELEEQKISEECRKRNMRLLSLDRKNKGQIVLLLFLTRRNTCCCGTACDFCSEKEEKAKTCTEKEYIHRRAQREEKHRGKRDQERRLKKHHQLNEVIAEEERKLLSAQRKLESKRLLSALFWRIEAKLREKDSGLKMNSEDLEDDLQAELETKLRQALLREQEQRLRKRFCAQSYIARVKSSICMDSSHQLIVNVCYQPSTLAVAAKKFLSKVYEEEELVASKGV
uniref:RRM domain-containing protein n=1 Tax=Setaria digitata TaxID=48799 RepID=A0A915PG22_9BILA